MLIYNRISWEPSRRIGVRSDLNKLTAYSPIGFRTDCGLHGSWEPAALAFLVIAILAAILGFTRISLLGLVRKQLCQPLSSVTAVKRFLRAELTFWHCYFMTSP
jgi:hypothetical protein